LYVEVDGRPPTIEALQHRVLANDGHFTSMQVRDGSVRGLELHLQRLGSATRELFDIGLDPGRVRRLVRTALDGSGGHSCSVRVDVFRQLVAGDASVMVSKPSATAMTRPCSSDPVVRSTRARSRTSGSRGRHEAAPRSRHDGHPAAGVRGSRVGSHLKRS
jgi:branched-subunit amino acid aminotransferase/4-amino-4-deoxychorismate lyase